MTSAAISPRPRRRLSKTQWAGLVLVVIGLVAAGIGAWQLWGTNIATARAQHKFLKQLQGLPTAPASPNAPPLHTPPPAQPFMVIAIPRMHLRAAVVEGVRGQDLALGPGHVPGTALPGDSANIAIAGHRATHGAPFARIETLQVGDVVTLQTTNGVYTYQVIAQNGKPWRLVQPSDIGVLAPGTKEMLTLISCHPQWASTNRVIVLAKPIGRAS
jgi:sortase A